MVSLINSLIHSVEILFHYGNDSCVKCVLISAVKWLIAINRIQNKSLFLFT